MVSWVPRQAQEPVFYVKAGGASVLKENADQVEVQEPAMCAKYEVAVAAAQRACVVATASGAATASACVVATASVAVAPLEEGGDGNDGNEAKPAESWDDVISTGTLKVS